MVRNQLKSKAGSLPEAFVALNPAGGTKTSNNEEYLCFF